MNCSVSNVVKFILSYFPNFVGFNGIKFSKIRVEYIIFIDYILFGKAKLFEAKKILKA